MEGRKTFRSGLERVAHDRWVGECDVFFRFSDSLNPCFWPLQRALGSRGRAPKHARFLQMHKDRGEFFVEMLDSGQKAVARVGEEVHSMLDRRTKGHPFDLRDRRYSQETGLLPGIINPRTGNSVGRKVFLC